MPIISSMSDDGREFVIKVEGRFDFSLHKSFREACSKVDAKETSYQVDLSRAAYIDSAALGMLLLLRERAGGDEASIKISGCRDDVQRILQVSKFHQLFEIE